MAKEETTMLDDADFEQEVPAIEGEAEAKRIRANTMQVMRKHLADQPLKTVYIDSESRYAQAADRGFMCVRINGFPTYIKVGERVQVPAQVAEILNASMEGFARAQAKQKEMSENPVWLGTISRLAE